MFFGRFKWVILCQLQVAQFQPIIVVNSVISGVGWTGFDCAITAIKMDMNSKDIAAWLCHAKTWPSVAMLSKN